MKKIRVLGRVLLIGVVLFTGVKFMSGEVLPNPKSEPQQVEQVEAKQVEPPKVEQSQTPIAQQVNETKPAEVKVEEKRSEPEVSRGSNGYKLVVEATAYSPDEPGDSGYAFDGRPAVPYRTIAVDPKVIPLGSQVLVPGYGWMIAHDTGGAIKGHIIDIRLGSTSEANAWGRREIVITVVPPSKPYKMAW